MNDNEIKFIVSGNEFLVSKYIVDHLIGHGCSLKNSIKEQQDLGKEAIDLGDEDPNRFSILLKFLNENGTQTNEVIDQLEKWDIQPIYVNLINLFRNKPSLRERYKTMSVWNELGPFRFQNVKRA